jgi:cholesterol oxidase
MSESNQKYDAVIVGSGFGGSINALRLAEAGKSVLVLERGRRYNPGEFPRDIEDVTRLFWRYPKHPDFRGLYEMGIFSGIATVVASGVGGGSLIYANIHIRPDPVVFEHPRWPRSINRKSLEPYYDKVAEMLGIGPVPEDVPLPKRDAFRRAAQQLNRDIFDPDQAVSWKEAGGPGREACRMAAECEFGCQYGAKNTLDLTYLAKAEQLGARIQTGTYVTHVEPVQGGYRIHYRDVETGSAASVDAPRAVLSAGTLGTNKILFQSRDVFRTLPNLSAKLGSGFSGNGDFLGSIQNSEVDLEPWNGPDVTSVMRYFDQPPQFTMAAPTFSQPVMEVLASLGQPERRWLRFLSPLLWHRLEPILVWAFRKGVFSKPGKHSMPNAGDPARMTNLFAIGRDNANGRLRLKNGDLDITWDYARENRELVEKMTAGMEEVNAIYGGTFAPLFTWNLFKRIITVHPLGGCCLSDSPEDGVVSCEGEVHGYPGLFVADGSVIPSSLGFHPCMTISAISERTAEAVVES